jgi:hypothetical protein
MSRTFFDKFSDYQLTTLIVSVAGRAQGDPCTTTVSDYCATLSKFYSLLIHSAVLWHLPATTSRSEEENIGKKWAAFN